MAVKFGSDGTVYCNTVKYNCKKIANLIPDNAFGQGTLFSYSQGGVWNSNYCEQVGDIHNDGTAYGYRSLSAMEFAPGYTNGTGTLAVTAPAPIAGHIYYGFMVVKLKSGYYRYRSNMEWVDTNSANGDQKITFFNSIGSHTTWGNYSGTGSLTSVKSGGTWWIRINETIMDNGVAGTNYVAWVSKPILIDLTLAFGANKEPSKSWCDSNIREMDVYQTYGLLADTMWYNLSTLTPTQWQATNSTNVSVSFKNRFTYDSSTFSYGSEPRAAEWQVNNQAKGAGGLDCTNINKSSINTSNPVYFQVDWNQTSFSDTSNIYLYFNFNNFFNSGISLASITQSANFSSGPANTWRRFSGYGKPTSQSTLFTIYWHSISQNFWMSNMCLVDVQYYATASNTSISNINREWCDRWIDGFGSSFIHIKDPDNTSIKFNTSYDIICNDIEIDPSLSKIYYDSTGTIHCKKLVKEQLY